jgi:hypothetical protein
MKLLIANIHSSMGRDTFSLWHKSRRTFTPYIGRAWLADEEEMPHIDSRIHSGLYIDSQFVIPIENEYQLFLMLENTGAFIPDSEYPYKKDNEDELSVLEHLLDELYDAESY